jgi:hypothetical protein
MNKIFFMTLFFIKRSSFGPFETRTFVSGFQMVQHSNARDRSKMTIRIPNGSGFRMLTVLVKNGVNNIFNIFCLQQYITVYNIHIMLFGDITKLHTTLEKDPV